MSGGADPYLLPNGTLRNKLGITSQAALQEAEDQATLTRATLLRSNLPKPPFTFDTLRSIHRELFQDVYAWAGEPRTSSLAKQETDSPRSPVQSFAPPETIVPRAEALFRKLADQDYLAGRTRAGFAAGATEAFLELNAVHFARVMLNCKPSCELGIFGSSETDSSTQPPLETSDIENLLLWRRSLRHDDFGYHTQQRVGADRDGKSFCQPSCGLTAECKRDVTLEVTEQGRSACRRRCNQT